MGRPHPNIGTASTLLRANSGHPIDLAARTDHHTPLARSFDLSFETSVFAADQFNPELDGLPELCLNSSGVVTAGGPFFEDCRSQALAETRTFCRISELFSVGIVYRLQ